MLKVPSKNDIKLVRVDKKISKNNNKRTKKNSINYLSQIVRNNIEEKNKVLNNSGGGNKQLKNLLSDAEEIERLLSKKTKQTSSTKKQTKKIKILALF